jgi:RNA polymerase sigma-70 factor (ECF subfamily)
MVGRRRVESETSDDDESAVVEAAQRDPRDFAPLYERYVDLVYRYAFHRLGDRDRAADATGQVFLKALAALPRYRAESFRSWLFAIAHNVVIDAGQRTPIEYALPPAWDASDPGQTPEEAAIDRDERRRLGAMLRQLTPEQREVIELYLAGMTSQEIAAHLGRGLAAVRSLQWRAFTRLRRLRDQESAQPTAKESDCAVRR